MGNAGVSFAGNGSDDVHLNKSETDNADHGASSTKDLTFAGNGADDVGHSFDTSTNNGAKAPGKGTIVTVPESD